MCCRDGCTHCWLLSDLSVDGRQEIVSDVCLCIHRWSDSRFRLLREVELSLVWLSVICHCHMLGVLRVTLGFLLCSCRASPSPWLLPTLLLPVSMPLGSLSWVFPFNTEFYFVFSTSFFHFISPCLWLVLVVLACRPLVRWCIQHQIVFIWVFEDVSHYLEEKSLFVVSVLGLVESEDVDQTKKSPNTDPTDDVKGCSVFEGLIS